MSLIVLDEGKKKIATDISIADTVSGDPVGVNSDNEMLTYSKLNLEQLTHLTSLLEVVCMKLEVIETHLSIISDEEIEEET